MLAAPSIGDRVIATFNAYDSLVEGLRARIAELQVSTSTLDALSGLPSGYTSKLLSKRPIRRLGIKSLGDLMGALGLRGQLIEDSAALAKVADRLKKRDAKRARDDSVHVVPPTRMTNNSILKLPGAFHCVKTSRIRFCAFSYSIGDPCGRSDQLSMYFIVTPLFALKSSERICSDQRPSLARAGFVDKSAFGRKQRRRSAPAAAAFGSKADIPS
jgi:hypothetical protein